MKNKIGASLYYASDKNIFDALCRSKVNAETIQQMFLARNILVSKKTRREELAAYFSRLPHDLADHKSIAGKLGVINRRERLTSTEVILPISDDELSSALSVIKFKLEQEGDVVHKSQDLFGRMLLNVKYSSLDYRKSEFSQVQSRDGELLLIPIIGGYKIRSTCNEYIASVKDSFISQMALQAGNVAICNELSLEGITDPIKRSEFFHALMFRMPGYEVKDVHEVYVYKKKPSVGAQEDEEEESSTDDVHVERVFLRGNGVSRSKQLQDLIKRDDASGDEPYYMVRVAWIVAEKGGIGQRYEIEARFEDPEGCTGFSYMLRGIWGVDVIKQALNKTKRAPTPGEIDQISLVIEDHAKAIRSQLI